MKGIFYRRIKKYCRLTGQFEKIKQSVIQRRSYDRYTVETIPSDLESCSSANKCYSEGKNCCWANGELFFANNPLIDNP